MARTVRLITLDILIFYLMARLPIPLLVIPLVGCMVVFNINEIKEIRNANKSKNKYKRHKKVSRKQS